MSTPDSPLPDPATEPTKLTPPVAGGAPLSYEEQPGTCIGAYKLIQKLGEGGMGVVWMASQEQPVRRQVALKIIKAGMDTAEVTARFETERQALALMDHPGIARVLDGGATASGRAWFAMELVKGVRLTDYCDQHKLNTAERLRLFIPVCQAVQHAHQKGIIHRDLKPSNVLVTLHDGHPAPKVIDFGIAKATRGKLTEQTMVTVLYHVMGTPTYMSPEQAEMSSLDIDTRADIYSLGVMLYELLTGHTPFESATLLRAGADGISRLLREVDPPRPSTRLSTLKTEELTTVAMRRKVPPPRLISLLRGDLDCVTMRCLEKDRTRRYESASALAADVQHFLSGEPVEARPPSAAYRIGKMVRRHRAVWIAGAAAAAALIVGLAVSVISLVRETDARRRAEVAEQNEQSLRNIAEQSAKTARDEESKAQNAKASAEEAALQKQSLLVQAGWNSFHHAERHFANVSAPTGPKPPASPVRFHDGTRFQIRETGYELPKPPGPPVTAPVEVAATSPPGKNMKFPDLTDPVKSPGLEPPPGPVKLQPPLSGIGSRSGAATPRSSRASRTVIDSAQYVALERSGEWKQGILHLARAVRFDPGNRAAAARFLHEVVYGRVHNLPRPLWSVPHYSPVFDGCVSSDGKYFLVICNDVVFQLKVADGRVARQFVLEGSMLPLAIDRAGTSLLAEGEDGSYVIYDLSQRGEMKTISAKGAGDVTLSGGALSPDGRLAAASAGASDLQIYTLRDSAASMVRLHHPAPCEGAVFSPAGETVAVILEENETVYLWDTPAGTLRHRLAHAGPVNAVAFAPDGARIAVQSGDAEVVVWDAMSGQKVDSMQGSEPCDDLVFSPCGGTLALVGGEAGVTLWMPAPAPKQKPVLLPGRTQIMPAFSADGTRVAVADAEGRVNVYEVGGGQRLFTFLHDGPLGKLIFAPDGLRLISLDTGGTVRCWDVSANPAAVPDSVLSPEEQPISFSDIMWHGETLADLTMVAGIANSSRIVLRNTVDGGRRAVVSTERPLIMAAMDPTGSRFAVVDDAGAAVVWSSGGQKMMSTPAGTAHAGMGLSADVRLLATIDASGTLRTWHTADGTSLATVNVRQRINAADWSPDARYLACVIERECRVIDLNNPSAPPVTVVREARGELRWSPDGKLLAVQTREGVQVWDHSAAKAGPLLAKAGRPVSFCTGGRSLLVESSVGRRELWSLDVKAAPSPRPAGETLNSWHLSPSGTALLTVGGDARITVIDTATGYTIGVIDAGWPVAAAQFVSDATHFRALHADGTVTTWPVFLSPDSGVTPEEMETLAEAATGRELSPEGLLTSMSEDRRAAARDWLDAQRQNGTAGLAGIARRLVPFGTAGVPDKFAGVLLAAAPRLLLQHMPSHPLVRIALAQQQKCARTAEFWREWDLARLPADTAVCAEAAAMLNRQGDARRALTAADKALAIDPQNAAALKEKEKATALQPAGSKPQAGEK